MSFWLHGARAQELARWWIRGTCEILMSLRKVTARTPCDTQLATYLFACNVFATCDRTLADILETCRAYAPRNMATVELIAHGHDAFGAVLNALDGIRGNRHAGAG